MPGCWAIVLDNVRRECMLSGIPPTLLAPSQLCNAHYNHLAHSFFLYVCVCMCVCVEMTPVKAALQTVSPSLSHLASTASQFLHKQMIMTQLAKLGGKAK